MKSLVVILLLFASISYSQNQDRTIYWKFFTPGKTTEEDMILIFGTPDIADIQCTYDDIKQAKQSDNKVDINGYALRYNRLRGDLNILKGPLGEASSAEVIIKRGKVYQVVWEYDGRYKDAADAAWANDKSLNRRVGTLEKTITMGSRKFSNGRELFISCFTGLDGTCSSVMTVMMILVTDKKRKSLCA